MKTPRAADYVTPEQLKLDDAGEIVLLPERVASTFVQMSRKKLQADRALTQRLKCTVGIPFVHRGKQVFYILRDCRRHLEKVASTRIPDATNNSTPQGTE